MHTYKFYFYRPISLIGIIITLATRCRYSHAAFSINGILYDASETRGDFNYSEIDNLTRDHIYYKIPSEVDLKPWAEQTIGTRYDWRGVIGWIFKFKNNRDQYYCFEAAWEALRRLNVTDKRQPRRIGAMDVINLIESAGYQKAPAQNTER